MGNITIFIDETGNFSLNTKTSYIGGWVCKSEDERRIKQIINDSIRYFNKNIKSKKINTVLNYPSDMHFMPLHLESQRKGKDSSIKINEQDAPIFFNHLFKSINNILLEVFRSTGKPNFWINEQAVYIDILRNTLLQLIDSLAYSAQKIKVIIAQRHPKHYGENGKKDKERYERVIADELKKEIRSAFLTNKPDLQIYFEDARYKPGLMLADFFCGAQRWNKKNYLQEYKNIKRYSFANGYKRIGTRLVQQVKYIKDIDISLAGVICLEVLSVNFINEEIKSLLTSMISEMNTSERNIFCKNTIDLVNEKIVNDPDRYSNLENMNKLSEILRSIFSTDYSKMEQFELQLIATLLINQIRIDSHFGKINSNARKEFLLFIDKHGDKTFADQMQIMQQRIDAVLIGVQLTFNRFKFDDIENDLKEIKNKYYNMFNFYPENNQVKDNNLARIEGTIGQMYGFIYDIENDIDYFELSEESLKADISATIKNTPSWEKANGYLTTLYWKKGDLDKAIDQFMIESGVDFKNKNKVLTLSEENLFKIHKKPFIQLHRLYLCALAEKNNSNTVPLDALLKEKDFILKDKETHKYPLFFSAKWLAIIFLLKNDYKNSLKLLNGALTRSDPDITIKVIKLPLKLLQHYALIKYGRKSTFSCQDEVKKLASEQKEFGEVLIKRGIANYYQNENNWSVYKIGTLLPFYFS